MNDPTIRQPSTTEEAAATPGWVEGELDAILADTVPARPAIARLRNEYLDCLAGSAGPGDADAAHDRCRLAFLKGLETDGVDEAARAALERRLSAMEAEISSRT